MSQQLWEQLLAALEQLEVPEHEFTAGIKEAELELMGALKVPETDALEAALDQLSDNIVWEGGLGALQSMMENSLGLGVVFGEGRGQLDEAAGAFQGVLGGMNSGIQEQAELLATRLEAGEAGLGGLVEAVEGTAVSVLAESGLAASAVGVLAEELGGPLLGVVGQLGEELLGMLQGILMEELSGLHSFGDLAGSVLRGLADSVEELARQWVQQAAGMLQSLVQEIQSVLISELQAALARLVEEGLEVLAREIAEHVTLATVGTEITVVLTPILPELVAAKALLTAINEVLDIAGVGDEPGY
jgi:hypothetical protein